MRSRSAAPTTGGLAPDNAACLVRPVATTTVSGKGVGLPICRTGYRGTRRPEVARGG
jgi:hypothetical protein